RVGTRRGVEHGVGRGQVGRLPGGEGRVIGDEVVAQAGLFLRGDLVGKHLGHGSGKTRRRRKAGTKAILPAPPAFDQQTGTNNRQKTTTITRRQIRPPVGCCLLPVGSWFVPAVRLAKDHDPAAPPSGPWGWARRRTSSSIWPKVAS